MTTRVLEPEWLDHLLPEEAAARQSRRDLKKLNFLMGHRGSMVRLLQRLKVSHRARRLIDLGSGDGVFALKVAQALRWKGAAPPLLLVDRQLSAGVPADGRFEPITADVFDFARALQPMPGTFVMANLFLHHFEPARLGELFSALAEKVDGFVACEPRRSRFAMVATRFLRVIGCNAVTRHDAAVSVRAGFLGRELSELWPGGSHWHLREEPCNLFTHSFMAWRP